MEVLEKNVLSYLSHKIENTDWYGTEQSCNCEVKCTTYLLVSVLCFWELD